MGARAAGRWVSWETCALSTSACGGEGLDRAPLAVLLGAGAQALWSAGKVLGGWGPHPAQLPTTLGSLGASPAYHHPLASSLQGPVQS